MLQQTHTKNARAGAFCSDRGLEGWTVYEDHPHRRTEYRLEDEESQDPDQEQWQADDEQDQDYDFEPEIYGDFHVAPKRRLKPDKHPATTQRLLETYTLAGHEVTMLSSPISTVVPPEIVRIVCSFASQRTLCCVLMLVCREWYYLAKPFVKRTGEWRCASQDAEDTLLDSLRARQIHNLRLYFGVSGYATTGREEPFNKEDNAWARFFSAITTPVYLTRNDSTLKGLEAVTDIMGTIVLEDTAIPKQCLLASVEQIIVSANSLWQPCLMPALLPYFGKIHTLNLSQTCSGGSIPLFDILDHCQSLQDLFIRGYAIYSSDYLTVCFAGTIPTLDTTATSTSSGDVNLRQSYPLKMFTVSRVALELGTLKRLVQSCPQMQEFHATNIAIWIFQGAITVKVPEDEAHIHFAPLYRLAASQCPNLSRFCLLGLQAQPQNHRPQPRTVDVVNAQVLQHFNLTIELFPNARVMPLPALMGGSWEPDRDTCLYLSRLTHLTISQALDSNKNLDTILRCAHALVSLIAPMVLFSTPDPLRIEDDYKRALDAFRKKRQHKRWDVHYKWHSSGVSEARDAKVMERIRHRLARQVTAARGNLPHPWRWMCKHLKTLDIGVKSPEVVSDYNYNPLEPKSFFAFLAKSCPLLENVTLRVATLHLGQRIFKRERNFYYPPRMQVTRYRWSRNYSSLLKSEMKDRFQDLDNDLLMLCGSHAIGEAPRMVHLRQLKIVASSVPGHVCASDFDFLGKAHPGGSVEVPWPALELFQICSSKGWTIVDHPRATETGKETVESVQAKVKARRPRLDLLLVRYP